MALIFMGLIFIPSGLLAYFSWRAFENEKLLSQRRLQESYRQFARLAAYEIDKELERFEKRWTSAVRSALQRGLQPERFDQLIHEDALVSSVFMLSGPGRVSYPAALSLENESASPARLDAELYAREHELFAQMEAAGSELEYRADDLNGAIAAYREILSRLTTPQLRGMAEIDIGRVQQKQGAWLEALKTFQQVLQTYPEVRDRNNLYLRLLAQYQIAVCLENLGRVAEAAETLLRLQQDLFERSDAMSMQQYSYFFELLQTQSNRLIEALPAEGAARHQERFRTLAEQGKKRVSQKYFLRLLDGKLQETIIERKHYKARFRYVSDANGHEPFLLAYHLTPDIGGVYAAGLVALEINLAELQQRLFPAILKDLQFGEHVQLGILNKRGDFIIGTASPEQQTIATHALSAPFNFWHVAVYLPEASVTVAPWDFRSTLGLWFVSLLLLSILSGAFLFVKRARREAYLSRMKSTFVSNVSHELRTPLASIKMLAELMDLQISGKSAAALDENKARQYLGVIGRECERLGRLIDNVLDFSKIERGFKQYRFEYEEPAAVLAMAVESFRPHAEAQGFDLSVEIPEDLPEVRMDADAVAQVMLNLLSNAVKYSDQVKTIRVRAYHRENLIFVEVADRGLGIPVRDLARIFESFYRVDQSLSASRQGGMGLGLTLAQHIVQAHGGEIHVESEVGKGSKFTFTLPLSRPAAAAPHEEAKYQAAPAAVE